MSELKQRGRALVLAGTLLVLALGCQGPEEALAGYLDAVNQGSAVSAYKFVSSNDRQFKGIKQYIADLSSERNNLVRAFGARTTYKIKGVEKKGGQAGVTVEITAPDYAAIVAEVFSGDPEGISGESESRIRQQVEQAYKGGQIPMTDNEWVYQLVKEPEGWKVYLGWESEAKVRDLLLAAGKLAQDRKLYEAKAKYQEVLQQDPGNAEAQSRMAELDERIAQYEQGLAYLSNLAISSLRVMDSVGGSKGIFMEIKNNGDRSLSVIELTMDFLDAGGNAAGSQSFVLVDDSRRKYDEAYAALLPGGSRRFGVSAKDAPAGWSGKVNVRVSKVQFGE